MIEVTEEVMRAIIEDAWHRGFDYSGEGFNGEYLMHRDRPLLKKQLEQDTMSIMMRIRSDDNGYLIHQN